MSIIDTSKAFLESMCLDFVYFNYSKNLTTIYLVFNHSTMSMSKLQHVTRNSLVDFMEAWTNIRA